MYYVTKYALTDGIWEVPPDKVQVSEDDRYIYVKPTGYPFSLGIQVPLKDYFHTLAGAEERVQEMVKAKLKSLDKARAKMANYKPKVVPK